MNITLAIPYPENTDYILGVIFSQQLLQKNNRNTPFAVHIFGRHKAIVTWYGITNFQNAHVWSFDKFYAIADVYDPLL